MPLVSSGGFPLFTAINADVMPGIMTVILSPLGNSHDDESLMNCDRIEK